MCDLKNILMSCLWKLHLLQGKLEYSSLLFVSSLSPSVFSSLLWKQEVLFFPNPMIFQVKAFFFLQTSCVSLQLLSAFSVQVKSAHFWERKADFRVQMLSCCCVFCVHSRPVPRVVFAAPAVLALFRVSSLIPQMCFVCWARVRNVPACPWERGGG